MTPLKRRMLIGGASLLGLSIIGLIVIPLCTRGPAEPVVGIERTEGALESAGPTLRVMTLNLAHGRADGVNQMLVSTNSIRDNLARVADFLTREAPDVVALQEADGPSFWSGRFDHVKTLAETARFGTFVRAENVKGFGLSYGTAVLSRAEVVAASGGTFGMTWPTLTKGYTRTTVRWPGTTREVVVVSVHLDFASASARTRQVDQLIDALADRGRPLVLMGDFNCGWNDDEDTLRRLTETLGLSTPDPEAPLVTFPLLDARLDWIFVSDDVEIRNHTIHDDVLSDHRAVSAELVLNR